MNYYAAKNYPKLTAIAAEDKQDEAYLQTAMASEVLTRALLQACLATIESGESLTSQVEDIVPQMPMVLDILPSELEEMEAADRAWTVARRMSWLPEVQQAEQMLQQEPMQQADSEMLDQITDELITLQIWWWALEAALEE